MSAVDTRNVSRDSLYLFAELASEGCANMTRIKVRNISAGGMMAEGGAIAGQGERVTVTLRGIGEVKGTVAWVQGNRYGIAFEHQIDPSLAREPVVASNDGVPRYARPVTERPLSGRALRRL